MSAAITVLDGQFLNPGDLNWDGISRMGSPFSLYSSTAQEKVLERAKDAEVILTNKVLLNRDVLRMLPRLRLICVMSTGYNVVDIDYCNEMGISLANVPAYSTPFVAQHTFALMLEIINKVGATSQKVRKGQWQEQNLWSYSETSLTELTGKKLGIIGMGNIGRKVAQIGSAFGMEIIYHSRNKKNDLPYSYCSLEDVIKSADVLSLHVPLTNENKHMINEHTLSTMKADSVLINTGRGDLINEKDLALHLSSKKIKGAGLDVLCNEPPEKNNPLIPLQNCVVTPHQAWLSIEARQRLMNALEKNIENFLGNTPINIVNNPNTNL